MIHFILEVKNTSMKDNIRETITIINKTGLPIGLTEINLDVQEDLFYKIEEDFQYPVSDIENDDKNRIVTYHYMGVIVHFKLIKTVKNNCLSMMKQLAEINREACINGSYNWDKHQAKYDEIILLIEKEMR